MRLVSPVKVKLVSGRAAVFAAGQGTGTGVGVTTWIRIGDARVNFATLSIDGPAGQVSVEPKVMDLLQVLIDNAGTVVSRTELLERVWHENYGGDESLSRAISLLRRAFGEVRGSHRYIETVPKRGYRLIAEVSADEGQVNGATAGEVAPGETDNAGRPGLPVGGVRRMFVLVAALLVGLLLYLSFNPQQQTIPLTQASGAVDTRAAPLLEPRSIAVLPFADLSSESDQQYFSDGLAEEILNALVKFPDLQVTGRTSSFSFRSEEPDLREVGTTLGVSHVLTGSLRKQGDRVRITARLVQTEDAYNVWSDTYDGDLDDIFDLQEDIAREIARNLDVVLDLTSPERVAPQLTADREAYALFLQGRALCRKFGHRNKTKARELLEQAVALDPNFADAWAWLAQAQIYLTLTAPKTQIPALLAGARAALQQSLSLNPDLAIGHYARTILLDYDLDFASSVDAVEKAYQLNPKQPFFAIRRGYYHALLGRSADGAALMEEGLRWDPTDAIGLLNLGTARQAMGQLERAEALYARSHDLGFEPAAAQICMLHWLRQDPDAAVQCWGEVSDYVRSRYRPVFQQPEFWSLLAQAIFRDEPAARREVLAILDSYFDHPDSHANAYLMQLYLGIGEPGRFMEVFLTRPFPLNAGALSGIWGDNDGARKVRQHPDFPAFAARIGLVDAWQKYGWPDKCQKSADSTGSNIQFACE
jgi:TolB-like protein/DNA-binding winged helix-turn-helix (wHTH) protein/lipoprotein NlpI